MKKRILMLLLSIALLYVTACSSDTENLATGTDTQAAATGKAVAVTVAETTTTAETTTVAEVTTAAETTAPPEDDSDKIRNTDIMGNVIDTVFEDPSIYSITLNCAVGWQPFGEYTKINTGDKINGLRVRESSSQFFVKHDRRAGDNNQLECFKNTYVLRKDVEGSSRFKLKGILYKDERGEVAFRPYLNEGDEYYYILCENDDVREYWQERTKFDVNGKIYDVQPIDIYGFYPDETADLFTEGVTYLEADITFAEIIFTTSSQGIGMYGTHGNASSPQITDTWLLETEYIEGLDGEKIYLYEGTPSDDGNYYTFDFGYITFPNEEGDGYFTRRFNPGGGTVDFDVLSAKTGYDKVTDRIDHTEITISIIWPGKLRVDEGGGMFAPGTVIYESDEFINFTSYTPSEPANRLSAVISNYTEEDITSYDTETYYLSPLRMIFSERQTSGNYGEIKD
jgi:hypothetical protein